jgi:hypothetical protein
MRDLSAEAQALFYFIRAFVLAGTALGAFLPCPWCSTRADTQIACLRASGSSREGEMLDGQVITGGPFTGTMLWPTYTCTRGLWLCTKRCPPNASGVRYRYTRGHLLRVN